MDRANVVIKAPEETAETFHAEMKASIIFLTVILKNLLFEKWL